VSKNVYFAHNAQKIYKVVGYDFAEAITSNPGNSAWNIWSNNPDQTSGSVIFKNVAFLETDPLGNLFVHDEDNSINMIYRINSLSNNIDANSSIQRISGRKDRDITGCWNPKESKIIYPEKGRCTHPDTPLVYDGAQFVSLNQPHGATVDTEGNLYIADTLGGAIRIFYPKENGLVDALSDTQIIAGGYHGSGHSRGDGIHANDAYFSEILDVAVDPQKNIYFIERNTGKLRVIKAP